MIVCPCMIFHHCILNGPTFVVSLRHEKYRTQYRAMFVMNCVVKRDEVLRYKTQQENKQRKRKRRKQQQTEAAADEAVGAGPSGMDADEVYHPVRCSECSTEVAVFDKDEVYHFFNILASHCWGTVLCSDSTVVLLRPLMCTQSSSNTFKKPGLCLLELDVVMEKVATVFISEMLFFV